MERDSRSRSREVRRLITGAELVFGNARESLLYVGSATGPRVLATDGADRSAAHGVSFTEWVRRRIPLGVSGGKPDEARRLGGALRSTVTFPRYPAPVAQRIEHLTTDQKVARSNRAGRAGEPLIRQGFSCSLTNSPTGAGLL